MVQRIAFKDMALSICHTFMTTAAKKHGLRTNRVIWQLLSGDTGKAAMADLRRAWNWLSSLSKGWCRSKVQEVANDHSTETILHKTWHMVTLMMPKQMWSICSTMWNFSWKLAANKPHFHQLTYEHWSFIPQDCLLCLCRHGQDCEIVLW